MTRKERLIRVLLWKKIKAQRKANETMDIANEISKVREIPDDEFDLAGDALAGREHKEFVIESYMYQKGFSTANSANLFDMTELLEMSEEEVEKILIDYSKPVDNSDIDKIWGKIKKENKTEKTDNHIYWCDLHGTDAPWAIDERCTCPGAYLIRKRMSEGMSFDDAKQWVIDNERI